MSAFTDADAPSRMATVASPRAARRDCMQPARTRPITVLLCAASGLCMVAASLIMLAVAILTLFRARRFYAERIATPVARAVLRMWGIRLVMHQNRPFPRRQTIYVSNHTSTLDLFILVALGLPRTRFFLSGFLRKKAPLGLSAALMGTFFTPPQTDPAARARCFQRAERILRRTGESVYLSPEGGRITTGEVGSFNKGTFHLATNLRVPIVPMYLAIPPDIDPGLGYDARPGSVHVYVKAPISTSDWKLEDLERNKEMVRERFLRFHEEHRLTPRPQHPGAVSLLAS